MNMHKYSKSFWRAFLVNIVQDCWIVWVIGFGLNTFRSQLKSVISTKIIINYDNDSKLLFAGMSCSSDCHWLPGLICFFLIYSLRFIRAVAYRWISAGFVGMWAGKTQGHCLLVFTMTSGLDIKPCTDAQEATERHRIYSEIIYCICM